MQKYDLLKNENSIIRVLDIKNEDVFIINCLKKSTPKWTNFLTLKDYEICELDELLETTGEILYEIEDLDTISRKNVYEKYNLISSILPFISNKKERCHAIAKTSEYRKISSQTINNYLWLYLVYQDISILRGKKKTQDKELSADEKNIRWALNKFFYTKNKNSLNTTYTLMLKEKYCNSAGILFKDYPSFYQFRYYYRKHKNMRTYYISRNGIKNYQRNNRPLIGENIQELPACTAYDVPHTTQLL